MRKVEAERKRFEVISLAVTEREEETNDTYFGQKREKENKKEREREEKIERTKERKKERSKREFSVSSAYTFRKGIPAGQPHDFPVRV